MSDDQNQHEPQGLPLTKRQQVEWDADQAMHALAAEAVTFDLDNTGLAERLLEEALPLAVSSLVHLSKYGETEKMRFDASKYIIDRNLGTPNQIGDLRARDGDPIQKLLDQVLTETNNTTLSPRDGGTP